jgi:hypothetical protein
VGGGGLGGGSLLPPEKKDLIFKKMSVKLSLTWFQLLPLD